MRSVAIVAATDDRSEKARKLAASIGSLGPYRWVGIYDVDAVEIERVNAFSDRDQKLLEECARTCLPLWTDENRNLRERPKLRAKSLRAKSQKLRAES